MDLFNVEIETLLHSPFLLGQLFRRVRQSRRLLLLPRHRIVREPAQVVLRLPPHIAARGVSQRLRAILAHVARRRCRVPEGVAPPAGGVNVGLEAAGADVDVAGVHGVPVGGSRRLVGEREVGLAFADDFFLGGHGDGCGKGCSDSVEVRCGRC